MRININIFDNKNGLCRAVDKKYTFNIDPKISCELGHSTSYKNASAHSEDSDQPAHPKRLQADNEVSLNAQVGLSLSWVDIQICKERCVPAHFDYLPMLIITE